MSVNACSVSCVIPTRLGFYELNYLPVVEIFINFFINTVFCLPSKFMITCHRRYSRPRYLLASEWGIVWSLPTIIRSVTWPRRYFPFCYAITLMILVNRNQNVSTPMYMHPRSSLCSALWSCRGSLFDDGSYLSKKQDRTRLFRIRSTPHADVCCRYPLA